MSFSIARFLEPIFRHFEHIIEPFPTDPVTVPPQGLYAFFRFYIRGSERQLVLLGFCALMLSLVEVSLFKVLGELVDWMAVTPKDEFLKVHGFSLSVLALLLVFIMPMLVFLYSLVLHQSLLAHVPMRIRWWGHRYLLQQSLGFFADDFAGRLSQRLMQTALAVRDAVVKVCDVFVHISVYFVAILFLLGASDWRLMAPLIFWLLCYVLILRYFLPRMKQVSAEQAAARSGMSGSIVDAYSNIATVKLFSHTERETAYARVSMEPFLETVYRQMRLATGLQVTVQSLTYTTIFLVALISIILWQQDVVSLGMVAVASMVTLRLKGLAQWLMWEANNFFESLGTVSDGRSTLAQPIAIEDQNNAKALVVPAGELQLRGVYFGYSPNKPVFSNLNLTIAAGEKVGIIGRSGAGKTSLIHLLLRFYQPLAGKILIDGQDIQTCTQESLRSHIGVVTQDTALLHRSVRENILYGAPTASAQDVERALTQAQATEFVANLHDLDGRAGLDAMVGERGVKLSGGQRQRIAIARVIVKNAPILILDEATSALDSEVEAVIQESLTGVMQGKTVIAIAHRLSTIAQLDRLIVLDQGEIIQSGRHQDLVNQSGLYQQLWQRQSGGFLGESIDD